MKHLVLLGAIFLVVIQAALLGRSPLLIAVVSPASSGGQTGWALSEDFEAVTGYDASGWSTGGDLDGVIDPDYTTSPAPILGIQSMRVSQGASGQKYAYYDYMPLSAVGTNTTGIYFTACWVTQSVGTVFLALWDVAGDAESLRLSTGSSGTITVTSGSSSATTVAATTVGHTNHFWVWWESNVVASVAFTNSYSTNVVPPVDGSDNFAKVTTGLGQKSVETIVLWQQNFSTLADTVVFDHVRVAFTNITGYGHP